MEPTLVFDRYSLFDELGAGGMATVHLGLARDAAGNSRAVAIKRMHPHIARDVDFRKMFLDEGRVVARIRHPNVVKVIDVAQPGTELWLVMEFVQGETLASLARLAHERAIPPPVAVSILVDVLRGLHAAHESTSEHGEPLLIVHRDVSPHNIIVGHDGVARVLDFGVAKAVGRLQTTRDGRIKGKAPYMAPEQLRGQAIDRRVDVYASAIVLWESLTGRRLFDGDSPEEKVTKILEMRIEPPGRLVTGIPPDLDAVVLRGLSRKREERFATAHEMADALERSLMPASAEEVSAWLARVAGDTLVARARRVGEIESEASLPFTAPGLETPRAPALQPPIRRGRLWALGLALGALALSVVAALGVTRLRARAPVPLTAAPAEAPRPSTAEPPDPLASTDLSPADSVAPESSTTASSVKAPVPRRRPATRAPRPPPSAVSTGFTKDRHDLGSP